MSIMRSAHTFDLNEPMDAIFATETYVPPSIITTPISRCGFPV